MKIKAVIFFIKNALIMCSVVYAGCVFSMDDELTADHSEGISAFDAGNYTEAEKYFLKQLKEPGAKNEALMYLSKIAWENGDGKVAVSYIEKALAIAPTNIDELLLSGNIYCGQAQKASLFSALKMAKKCIAQYEAAVKMDGENINALVAAIRFYVEAPSIAGGSTKKAKAFLERLHRLSPEEADIYSIQILEVEGDSQSALQLADELSKQGFQSAISQYKVAHYYRDKKHYDKALTLFEALSEMTATPDNQWQVNDSLLQLGEIYILKGNDVNKGIELIEQYKEVNNDPQDIHYFWSSWSLAKGYKAVGQQEKYEALVKKIKAEDYKQDSAFAKDFEANI